MSQAHPGGPKICFAHKSAFIVCAWLAAISNASAQIDLRITPSESDFTIAVPPTCTDGSNDKYSQTLSTLIAGDLSATGLYRVQGPRDLPEPIGNCSATDGGAFPADLPSRRINQLVTGKVKSVGAGDDLLVADLYLRDVAKNTNILGRRYQISPAEVPLAAHAFANEILALLTGEAGSFGGQIVYVSDSGKGSRELFSIVLGSTARRQVSTVGLNAEAPSWSVDGKQITFSAGKSSDQLDLYLVPATGGKATKVTFLSGSETDPVFAPDGKQLLAASEVSGKQSLVFFNFRGRLMQKLTETTFNDSNPAYSPGGDRIAFISDRQGAREVYLINAEGGAVKRVDSTAGKNCSNPVWSPDESKLAVSCETAGVSQLFLTTLGAKDLTQITFQGDNADPAWSPDGRMIVFTTRDSARAPGDLAVFSMASLKVTMVAKTPEDDGMPHWSNSKAGLEGDPL